jgi:DtxR family Mn-dependent transcriptional regulator
MNFGWENVHEIAEQLEHVHSTIFFDKMDEILDYPKFDPHGEPIPIKTEILLPRIFKTKQLRSWRNVVFASVTFLMMLFNYLTERSSPEQKNQNY